MLKVIVPMSFNSCLHWNIFVLGGRKMVAVPNNKVYSLFIIIKFFLGEKKWVLS